VQAPRLKSTSAKTAASFRRMLQTLQATLFQKEGELRSEGNVRAGEAESGFPESSEGVQGLPG
jgi:hypothetical protein